MELTSADFPLAAGCGDVFVHATTADGRFAVVINWEGAATTAWETGGLAESATLPSEAVSVSLEFGQALSSFYCNDLLTPGQGVQATTPAVAGSVELAVRPQPGGFRPAAIADLTLTDVRFEVTTGDDVEIWTLDRLELRNVSVGWFAG